MRIEKKLLNFFWLAMLAFFLMSCSTQVSRKDGPPNFYVDATKIPNAKPKLEPLSKYGNMPSYRVFGKRYYVLKSSKHYQAFGIASWYGSKFHSRRTSSGEPYNMLSMTAAHKTLPLPTYVEVTNLENRKKIIVKVNDRGPFHSNRLIDLSYVAAKKLGILARGTGHVVVRAIDPRRFYRPIKLFVKSTPHRFKSLFKGMQQKHLTSGRSVTPVIEAKPSLIIGKNNRTSMIKLKKRSHLISHNRSKVKNKSINTMASKAKQSKKIG